MKDLIVGSSLGAVALQIRNWTDLKSVAFRNPEKAAAVANAIIADRLITRMPEPGSSFLDIGAHIGSIFSAVHRNVRGVTVRAIEAEADKAAALKEKFPFCEILNYAVGEERGTAVFHLHDQSGYNSLANSGGAGVKTVEVEVRTLDELLPDIPLDFIKIDIEGAELGALRGGKDLLARTRPTIMFESTQLAENSLGYSPAKIWQWLHDAGFELFTPDRVAHDAPALTSECFLDSHAYPMRTHNYFAIPAEKRTQLRDRAREILGVRAN